MEQVNTDDAGVVEPENYAQTVDKWAQADPPNPNEFMRTVWSHLDPAQRELAAALMTPPVRKPEQQLGVAPESGGLARPEDKMYMSSDQLMNKALMGMPQAFQDLKNTKIDRPADLSEVYGQQTALGGYYRLGADYDTDEGERVTLPSTVAVGRGGDLGHDDMKLMGGNNPVRTARHELAHQINYEHPTYKKDQADGYPLLIEALEKDWASLMSNPQTYELGQEVKRFSDARDPQHVFTALALASKMGAALPPNIRRYLSSLNGESRDETEK